MPLDPNILMRVKNIIFYFVLFVSFYSCLIKVNIYKG